MVSAIAAAAAVLPVQPAGYGAGLGSAQAFEGALARAGGAATPAAPPLRAADVDAVSPAIKAMMGALERVNGQARAVGDFAKGAMQAGRDLTPGEIVQLTMRCHEFMFHCQLSSSIANRTSDGLQQLFRQQS